MADLLRRFGAVRGARASAIAITTLVLTVGVAFAAGPNGNHGNGHGNSGNHGNHGAQASQHPDASEAPESETPENEGPEDAAGDGHGALVSTAARMATPAGFANHGAFVSCVAHMKDVTLATIDWASVTPSSCDAAKSAESSP
jgi:hypothetical protein